MDIIKTVDLCYSYDDKLALNKVNFSVKQGEITAVLGGNGAGKSTLFLNLNGVLKPDSGQVYYNGKLIKYTNKNIRLLSENIGIVFQDPNDQLFSDSVRNDIAFGAINMGIPKEKIAKLVEEAARQTGIYELLDKPTHALSFGQKKRAAIAGVLIMKPKVLILDEPTAGLDPQGVSDIMELLNDIKAKTGASIIISTHEIDLVPLLCSRCYIMNEGRIEVCGTVDEVFANPENLRGYGLRTPRIMHLMEVLAKEDNLNVDKNANTISKARKSIKSLFEKCK